MRSIAMSILLLGLAMALSWTGDARAGTFAIELSEDGHAASVVASQSSGGTLTLSGTYAAAPDFNFAGFHVISNANLTTGSEGEIMGAGTILPTGTSTHTLTILVSDDGFTFPAGPIYITSSSSSYTAVNNPLVPSGDSFIFQSFSTPGQDLFGTTVPSPPDSYSPLLFSDSGPTSATPFTAAAGYTLTQRYDWVSTGTTLVFQPTGSTITSIPEPASWVLALLGFGGSIGLASIHRPRRRSA
jgi:hypothetical protein